VQRIKACMKKIEAEEMLEQDGVWLYWKRELFLVVLDSYWLFILRH
jgi:hypothetical protein